MIIMKMRSAKSQHGFTLLELMIASFIGILVMAAMTSMFRVAMNTMLTVTQRAETQQNLRAGIDMMTKDISLAGSGLPTGGLQLAAATQTKFACNQGGTCYLTNHFYPLSSAGTINYMYGILPGFNNGVENGVVIPNAPGAVNDSITSIYCDYNFPLTNFAFTFNAAGTAATVGPAATIVPGLPTNILAPGGLVVGDLMLFVVNTAGNGKTNQGTSYAQTAAAVGEITGLPDNVDIDFATADPLNFNQSAATPNSLANAVAAINNATNSITACRLNAVTYFLEVPVAGATGQTPRLMRQVNGGNAVPVADNIINLQLSYDVINSNLGTIDANRSDPIGFGDSPALIQKVNMWVMAEGLQTTKTTSQSMYLASSASTRNMSFCNSLSSATKVCQ